MIEEPMTNPPNETRNTGAAMSILRQSHDLELVERMAEAGWNANPGFAKFAARVLNGEFDATKEESDEWARSPSGQDVAKRLPAEMRDIFGLKLNN